LQRIQPARVKPAEWDLCAASWGVQAGEGTKQPHDSEQATHRGLHPTGRSDFEEEARLTLTRVAHDVDLASWHPGTAAHPENLLLATDSHRHSSGNDLDALVLPNVGVARDPTSGIQPHFDLQRPDCVKVRCCPVRGS
jgi:hypothetical protein